MLFFFFNFDKTQFVQFTNNNLNNYDTLVFYEDNYIAKVNDIKFLGLNINNTLTWTTHIEKILPKLSSACFALRSVKPFVSMRTLKIIYYGCFHSIMSYGIIFWGHTALGIKDFRKEL